VQVVYDIAAVIVHIGANVNSGHYVTCAKIQSQWLCFDDSQVSNVISFSSVSAGRNVNVQYLVA